MVMMFSHKNDADTLADGQNVSHEAVYVNYALHGTPLEDRYGANVGEASENQSGESPAIDPKDVMLCRGLRILGLTYSSQSAVQYNLNQKISESLRKVGSRTLQW